MAVTKEQLLELQKVMPFRRRVWSWAWKKQADGKYPKYRVLAYVDSRDVMDRLDAICWPLWRKREHMEIKGSVYCGVSIHTDNWRVTKRDVGSESNIEKEKWAASDSFKRACINRGIGRFLYTVPAFIITREESVKNYYSITSFVRNKFRSELEKRYDVNQIKIDNLESKYEEWRGISDQEEVPESIEDAVDLTDRKDTTKEVTA